MRNYFCSLAMAIALLIATCQVTMAQQMIVLSESFDNISSGVPTGWDVSDYYSASSWGTTYVWQSDADGYNNTRGLMYNTYSAYTNSYSALKTPVLSLYMPMYLRFKYQNYNAGDLSVYISLDGGATYTTLVAQSLTTASADEWGEAEYSLSAYTGQSNVKIVFYSVSNYGYQRQYLDDVVVEAAPTCKHPTGLYISNLTTTDATLNWSLSLDGDVPSYYQLLVTDQNGNTIVSNDSVPGSSISYQLTGLTANTTYTVSMRGDCNSRLGGYSSYETYSFTTGCNTLPIPYTENFDALSGLPDCTTSLNCSITSSYKYGTSGKSLQFATTASNSAYMVFPLLNHAANDLEVSFMIRGYNSSTPVAFQVGVVGDAADIEGTFEPLYIDSAVGTTWTEVRMNTTQSSYTTSPSEICIFIGSGTTANIYVDNVSIHTIPTCIRPEQFRAYNVTASSVDLAWTTSTAQQHIIYITDANSNVTRQVATTNPYTVTGLQPNSSYSFNIRALCTASDSSDMATATPTATTLCMPQATAIWSEGAEGTSTTATIPNCWSVGYFNKPSSSYTSYTDPITTTTSYKHTGSRGFQLRDMTSGTISYLSSNGFTIDSANKYQASVWVYRQSGTSSNGEGIRLYVSTQPDDITGAEELGFINRCAGNAPVESSGYGWYNYTYPIATTGVVYLIVQGESKWGSSTYFDDISVGMAPTCLPSGDVTIGTPTMSDVTLTWSAGTSNETSWVLVYTLKSGSTVVSTDSVTVTSPTYTVTGLSAATSYTLTARVYAVCSPTDMSTAKSASSTFTTPCATITALPYTEDFESMTANTIPTCWDNSGSTSTATYSYYIWGVYSYSSNKMLRMYNYLVHDGDALINTPTISLPAQPAELQFDYSNKASSGDLYVKISTDNGSTFTNLGNYSSSGSYSQNNPGTFTSETIDLSSYSGQDVIIQFYVEADYGSGAVFIDNIVISQAASCRPIAGGATVYDVTPNSARVSISDTSVTDWDICYGPTGTAAGAGTIINVTGRMDTIITGLTNNQTYDVYVRRNCGPTDLGAWTVTPVTFTCTCTDISATISDVDAHSAKVSVNATDWEISYGPLGTTEGGGTVVPVTGTNQYVITGLTPATSYVLYVRHNCNGAYSDWSYSYTITTTAVPDSLPFGTGFENVADDAGWQFQGSSTSALFMIGSDANAVHSGSRALYMSNNGSYGYNTGTANRCYAYRSIYLPSGVTHFSFDWKCTGGEGSYSIYDYARIMLVPVSETLPTGTGSNAGSTGAFPNFTYALDPDPSKNYINLQTGDADGWNTYSEDISISVDSAGTYNFVVMWRNDGSQGSTYPISIDNISISQVTCNVPTVLASALTSNGGTVTATSQATQNIEVVVSSTAIDIYGTVTGDLYQGVTSAPVVITSLQPNTTFYYTARAICGPGDTSNWAAVQSARTACSAMSVPYTEGFEDSGALTCWPSMGTPTRNTQYHYAGVASCKIADCTAVSPELNVTSLSTYMLTGQAYATTDSTVFAVGVMVDPSDASTYIDLGTVTVPTRNTWTEFTTYFSLLTDDDYIDFINARHFAIFAGSDATVYVDDLYLGSTPTCPKPTEISITNVMSNTCEVAWTNNAVGCTQWIVKATPATAGAQTVTQVATTNPVTITGLNPASAYSISVAALCSATDTSLWAAGGTITTACAIVNAPYSEDFEFQTVDQTPNCWDISSSTTSTATSNPAYVWGTYEYGGNKMIYMNNWYTYYGFARITSPIISLAAGNNYVLQFDYSSRSDCDSLLTVGISTDGGTTWATVGSYGSTSSSESETDPGSWTTASYGLGAYSGSNIMLRFSINANYGSGAIFVDNVKVTQLRNCLDVASVSGNVGANDVAITINDTVSTHTQWQYMYGAMGFDTTSVTPTLISTDTFTITGLTASTNYTVYVRAYCDATEQSNWTAYNFKTTSQPAAFPYVCHFTDATENAAWEMSFSGSNAFTIGTDANACNTGETSALYVAYNNSYGYYNRTTSAACAYRLFRFNASQYNLHFSWKCTGGESSYDYARFYLIPATSTPSLPPTGYYSSSSWPSNIIALDGGTKVNLVSSPVWNDVDMTLDMSANPGSYYLVFNWSNDGSSGNNYPLAINDIEISELTCIAPVITVDQTSITTNSAAINYSDPSGGGTIRYWYNTTGNSADSTNIATVTGSPITLTGLASTQRYYVYMQKTCSATDKSSIASANFKTLGVATQLPYICDFEDAGESGQWDYTQSTTNYFTVGTATSNGGSSSMYITNDGTNNTYNTGSSAVSFACRNFQLTAGQFNYSFDWKADGESSYDYARVFLVPESVTFTAGTLPTGVSTTGTPSGWIALDNNAKLNQKSSWETVEGSFTLTVAGGYNLTFIWRNDYSYGDNPPLAIDNISLSQLVNGPTYQDTVCNGNPYIKHGFNIPASSMSAGVVNTFSRIASGIAGAEDTVVTAKVLMQPIIMSMAYDTLCQGDTLHWNGYTVPNPTPRMYFLPSLTSVNGCDSFATMLLTILPTFSEIYDTICQGNVYTFRGQTFTQTNSYTIVSQNARGCTDTTILHLYAVPTHSLTNATTCSGSPYTWHGNSYSTSGTYYWSGTGSFGCMVNDTLVLTVSGGTKRTESICQGGSTVFGSQTITQAGTYYNSYVDAQTGCNLTDTLIVTVTDPVVADVYGDACEGVPYWQHGISGQTFTQDTVITVTTKTASLCDSTTRVHITCHPTEYTDTTAAISKGETFTWYGNTYNTAGDYTENLQSVYGCDSIVTLHLYVRGVGVDNVSDINISIVPNPVNAGATAFVYGNFGVVKSVEILNNFGQVIDQFEPKSYPIEVSGIAAAGLYYVRVTTLDGNVHLQKLVVK